MDIVDGKFAITEGDVTSAVIGCKLTIEGSNSQVVGAEADSYGVTAANGHSYIIVLNTRVTGDAKGGPQPIHTLSDDHWTTWDDSPGNKECMVDDCNLAVHLAPTDLFSLYAGSIEEEVTKWGHLPKALCSLVLVSLCVCMS